MREIDLAVELQKATTGSMHLSVIYVPVDVMIQRKAAQLDREKNELAGSVDPELAKKQKQNRKEQGN